MIQTSNAQDLNYWRISILGKKCEVFWSPPETTTPSSDMTSNSDAMEEFEADWYEAIVKRYDIKRDLFEVSFVGEDKKYFLTLDPTNTRKPFSSDSHLDQPQSDLKRLGSDFTTSNHLTNFTTPSLLLMENSTQITKNRMNAISIDLDTHWIQYIVGKEWEVFWQSKSTSRSQEDHNVHETNSVEIDTRNDDDDDESFYSDWYDALILSFCPLTCTFQVSFVGDDDDSVHNMFLEPKDVRVAARSWVKRTLLLLDLNMSNVLNDNGTMKQIHDIDLELPPKCIPWNPNERTELCNSCESDKDTLSSPGGEFDLHYYQQLLQDQLITRSHLVFSDENKEESKNQYPEENSQQHIDYLVECIHLVLDVCRWYNENTPEHFYNRFLKSSIQKSNLADLYICTIIGIMKLIKASKIDLGRRRKKQPCQTPTHSVTTGSSCRSNVLGSRKRRKIKTNTKYDVYQGGAMATSDQTSLLLDVDDLDIESLTNNLTDCRSIWNKIIASAKEIQLDRRDVSNLTNHSLSSVLSEYKSKSNSYLRQVVSDCIFTHHIRCWEHLSHWKHSARSVLGPKYNPQDHLLDIIDDNDDKGTYFTLSDMQKCLSDSKSGDISKFDVSSYVDALNQKMMDVFCFQKYAWDLLVKVEYSEIDTNSANLDTDMIIRDLEKLKESPLCPRDSKNAKTGMTEFDLCVDLNTSTIENAINLRRWMLRCHRACSHKERVYEYINLAETHPGKLRIPTKVVEKWVSNSASALNSLELRLQVIQTNITEMKSLNCNRVHNEELLPYDFVSELFLTESEEKCTIMNSIIQWQKRVDESGAMADKVRLCTQVIDSLFNDLSSLQEGISEERSLLVKDLLQYQHIDDIIAEFSKEYISRKAGTHKDRIVSLYESSKSWRNKSSYAINVLMSFGNDVIGKFDGTPIKAKQYLDLKYIEQLIEEHELSNFASPPNIDILKEVLASCKRWSGQLAHCIMSQDDDGQGDGKFSEPPLKQLDNLENLSKCRPKGINLYPPKQTLSKWIDFLTWYKDCTNALNHLSDLHVTKTEKSGETGHLDILEFTKGNALVESLIFTGYEIILFFSSISSSKSNNKHFKIDFSREEQCFLYDYLAKRTENSSYTRRFLRDDISNAKSIIFNMMRYDESLSNGGIFFKLHLYLWKTIAVFIMSQIGDKRKATNHVSSFQPTLETVTSILSHLENFPTAIQDLQFSDAFIQSLYSSRIEPLRHLVTEASELESQSQSLLSHLELFSGDITHEWIAKALEDLRSMKRKIRVTNEFGLKINSIYLTQVEKRIRDLSWLSNAENAVMNIDKDVKSSSRLPFQSLNSMIEKSPSQCKQMDNRVHSAVTSKLQSNYRHLKKWHDACLKWLDEVKEFLPKSATKGTKQREIRSVYGLNESIDKYAVVSEKVIENLMVSDILQRVEMKEEIAIQESYRRTIELKQKMHDIFGIDHVGNDVDRTTLPDHESLLGVDGAFYFKRLTGSPEFHKLRDIMNAAASSAEDLPVKTLEKITYDWICEALNWIDKVSNSLKDPINGQSPFEKIYLSSKDAEELVNDSTSLFFDGLTDDIKKYLSAHKVSISPRSGSGKVHVKNNKGGSIHSIGGTVLRWIAFMCNALKQDYTVSSQWTKLVKGYIAKQQSEDNQNTLRTLLTQMQDLIVAPEEEVVSELLNRLDTSNHSETWHSTSRSVFVHQLLGD